MTPVFITERSFAVLNEKQEGFLCNITLTFVLLRETNMEPEMRRRRRRRRAGKDKDRWRGGAKGR